jgi:hypothetical protein
MASIGVWALWVARLGTEPRRYVNAGAEAPIFGTDQRSAVGF